LKYSAEHWHNKQIITSHCKKQQNTVRETTARIANAVSTSKMQYSIFTIQTLAYGRWRSVVMLYAEMYGFRHNQTHKIYTCIPVITFTGRDVF